MSKVVIQGDTNGTGVFTVASPNSNTDRTLTLPDEAGTIITSGSPTVLPKGVPAFSATRSAAQTVSASTWTKIQFSTEVFDTANCYDHITNYRFTPNVAGYYQISVLAEANTTSWVGAAVFKNGSTYRSVWSSNPGVGASAFITSLVYLNGSTDYVEPYIYQNVTAALYTSDVNYEFSGVLVRAD